MGKPIRATRARIYLDTLRENLANLRRIIPRGVAICAAVKANAYGHGVLPVAETLRDAGVEALGVSSPFEGIELREGGDAGRILLLGPTVEDEIPLTIVARLEPVITDAAYLFSFEKILAAEFGPAGGKLTSWRDELKTMGHHPKSSSKTAGKLAVHLKIDTGMGRVGCRPSEAPALAERIFANPRLFLAGTATHFPSADSDDPEDIAFTGSQISCLLEVADKLREKGINPGTIHASNSGGIAIGGPKTSFDMVRPGIFLYGYGMAPDAGTHPTPIMEFVTRITALKKVSQGTCISYGRTWKAPKDTWIATLPVGYADGYPRLCSNRSEVLISGKRYPVVGAVCMDQMMVDLGSKTNARPGDEAVLFGPQGPDAAELAALTGTISYEITCGISPRVPRVFVDRAYSGAVRDSQALSRPYHKNGLLTPPGCRLAKAAAHH